MRSRPFHLHRTLFTLNISVAVLLGAASVGHAQDAPAAPPHLAVVDGSATLERERSIEAATPGVLLIPGDRLRTTGGRVEVLFADGSSLDVDEYTTADVQSETLLRLVGGRALLTVASGGAPGEATRYQVDTPVGSARNEGPGEFRLAVMNAPAGVEGELAVLRGAASFTTESGSTVVRAGERSLARENSAPSFPQPFNSARFDAFDRWTSARRDDRLGAASAQYLPRDLQTYGGTFDRNGSWQYDASYGYVWFPAVTVGWRPYYNGYWNSVRPYGWTWIGLDPWAWPTHHYGRWGVSRDRWYWIPDRHWSSAWVSWAAAPGYVSWCPLGFDNRPVFSLAIGVGNPWGGWVLAPRATFGAPGRLVPQYAVGSPALSPHAPLVVQAGAPAPPARAVPRSAAGIGVVPRANAAVTAGSTIPDTTRGRAIARDRATLEDVSAARPAASPIFKQPLPTAQRRATDSAAASREMPERVVAVPGARPYRGDTRATASSRQESVDAAARVRPSPPPQTQASAPETRARRYDAAQQARPQYVPARPSISMPSPEPPATRPPAVALPRAEGRPSGTRQSPEASRSTQDSPPPQARPGAGAAPAPSAGSAESSPSQGAPPGARTAHRR